MQTVLACFSLIKKRTFILAVFMVAAAFALPSVPARAAPPPDPIADVVAKVRDAVVRITSVQPQVNPSAGKNLVDASDANPPIEIGSGFIINSSGLVATNRHVVENATAVFVGTQDGGRYRAELIVSAGETDIALLKINSGEKLPVVTFGDSDTVRVGDAVIAIGDPFGFGGSVSAGVVSATNRNIQESPFDEYIQTDAAINHGSSGGPLFNLSGQVIGMDSVLYAPGTYSGSAGVGFAIPSNVLRFVLSRLETDGKVGAGRLPLLTQRVPELMAAAIGVPEPGGAVVIATTAQAEALAGKIQPGDVIKTFEGTAVLDPRDLARKAASATVGSRVTLGIFRLGQMTTIEVPILPLPTANPTVRQSFSPKILGLHLIAGPGTARNQGSSSMPSIRAGVSPTVA